MDIVSYHNCTDAFTEHLNLVWCATKVYENQSIADDIYNCKETCSPSCQGQIFLQNNTFNLGLDL